MISLDHRSLGWVRARGGRLRRQVENKKGTIYGAPIEHSDICEIQAYPSL